MKTTPTGPTLRLAPARDELAVLRESLPRLESLARAQADALAGARTSFAAGQTTLKELSETETLAFSAERLLERQRAAVSDAEASLARLEQEAERERAEQALAVAVEAVEHLQRRHAQDVAALESLVAERVLALEGYRRAVLSAADVARGLAGAMVPRDPSGAVSSEALRELAARLLGRHPAWLTSRVPEVLPAVPDLRLRWSADAAQGGDAPRPTDEPDLVAERAVMTVVMERSASEYRTRHAG